jgi:nitrate reductase (cytochrome), electron transfer subunit
MRLKPLLLAAVIPALAVAGTLVATAQQVPVPPLYGAEHPMELVPAPPFPPWVVDDVRRMRAYPEQPPVIPHSIEGYQITVHANRCLSCHSREFVEGSGAPMISVTHYQNRDGQTLAGVAPRRYFCTACHVPQSNVPPLVENLFTDMSDLTAPPTPRE